MGTGQIMLTIGAMLLLTITILNVNRGAYNTNTTMADSRYNILSVAVATSIIEDATGLAFDENTTAGAVSQTSSLTASTSFGVNAGETGSNPTSFDDFDDYNVYKTSPKFDTIPVAGTNKRVIFNTLAKVDYVTASNLNNVSTSPTWHKRLSIRVYCPEIRDPITLKADTVRLSTVYSYWYFR
jgi:hypothetical protein